MWPKLVRPCLRGSEDQPTSARVSRLRVRLAGGSQQVGGSVAVSLEGCTSKSHCAPEHYSSGDVIGTKLTGEFDPVTQRGRLSGDILTPARGSAVRVVRKGNDMGAT